MKYYYTDSKNQPVGPVEYSEMLQLAEAGTIHSQTSTLTEGSQHWTTWGELKAGDRPPTGAAPGQEFAKYVTVLANVVGAVLARLTSILSANLFRATSRRAGFYGHLAVTVGAIFGIFYAALLASRMQSMTVFALAGPGLLIALAVAQFAAERFMTAGAKLIAGTPNRIASRSFLECVGVFAVLSAFSALLNGVVDAIRADSFLPVVPAIVWACILVFMAAAALHPEELNVLPTSDASAGEEAISIISFFAKMGLVLAPLLFMLVAILGATASALLVLGNDTAAAAMNMIPLSGSFGMIARFGGLPLVITACLIPFLTYVLFLFVYLSLDLLRAVLTIPAKLDGLNK